MEQYQQNDKPIKIVKSQKEIDEFFEFCSNLNNESTLCIDMEFNRDNKNKTHLLGLFQIMVICDHKKYFDPNYEKPIFIINPEKFNKKDKIMFSERILESKSIKILHGSDSMDLPYVSKNWGTSFLNFLKYTIDTRFLCELYNNIQRRMGNNDKIKSCSLIRSLCDFDVINKEECERLKEISSKINYNKIWDIENLTKLQTEYSAMDIFYLYDLFYILANKMKPIDPNKIDPVIIVSQFYRFHIRNHLGYSNVVKKCKIFVSKKINDFDDSIKEHVLGKIIFEGSIVELKNNDIIMIETIKKSTLACISVIKMADHTGDLIKELENETFTPSNIFY
jgi:hypothetical protein